MTSTELCIELASKDDKWDQYDDATKAALAILQDCKDRRGIKGQFNACHEDVLSDIVDSWAEIIRFALQKEKMIETGFVARRIQDLDQKRSVREEREVAPQEPEFEMIRDDLKLSWKAAVRALNSAENTGATDTACQIKDIVIGLSTALEFCETMTETQ